MKGIVIFDTSHGNTRAVAETIARTLKESGIDAETRYVKDVKKLEAEHYISWSSVLRQIGVR